MNKSKAPTLGGRKAAPKRGAAGVLDVASRAPAGPTADRGRRGRARDAEFAGADVHAAAPPPTGAQSGREHAAGAVRRKNMFVPQALLDRAREALGVKTETEAVALGLGAAVDLAEFRREMLAGFDELMAVGGLSPVEGEEVVLDGFRPRPPR